MTPDHTSVSYHLITLGCPKNEADSSGMEALLQDAHLAVQPQAREADVIIVNTCGFLQAAIQESLSVLQEQAARKRRDQTLIAAGCLAQRQGDLILQTVPEVDGLLGTRRWREIVPLVRRLREGPQGRRQESYALLGDPATADMPLARTVTAGSAYLRCPMAAMPPVRSVPFRRSRASCTAVPWMPCWRRPSSWCGVEPKSW